MQIVPALDLMGGRCVRLLQDRYDRVIAYEHDPLDVAARFRAAGAEWLHVIDLEGSRDGQIRNFDVLRSIVRQTSIQVEFGGGVRDEGAIRAALEAGAARVIVGTRALEDWAWFEKIVHAEESRGRLALGLDGRLGKLVVRGRTCETGRTATEVVGAIKGWPLAMIVYTDIGRDGLLLGPNLASIEAVRAASSIPVTAAGGVADLDDVRRLAEARLAGVVIGRALYEGKMTYTDAVAAARAATPA